MVLVAWLVVLAVAAEVGGRHRSPILTTATLSDGAGAGTSTSNGTSTDSSQASQHHSSAPSSPPGPPEPKRYSSSDLVQTLYDQVLPVLAARRDEVARLTTKE
jgi:hypothetical protein